MPVPDTKILCSYITVKQQTFSGSNNIDRYNLSAPDAYVDKKSLLVMLNAKIFKIPGWKPHNIFSIVNKIIIQLKLFEDNELLQWGDILLGC